LRAALYQLVEHLHGARRHFGHWDFKSRRLGKEKIGSKAPLTPIHADIVRDSDA
jgi:hypothetical protein